MLTPTAEHKVRRQFGRMQLAIIIGMLTASSLFADNLSLYKEFVSHTPWTKQMSFAQSGNLFPVRLGDSAQRDTVGYVLFNAAVQPNSWYLEIATNAPIGASDARMGNGYVLGRSLTNYWSVMASKKKFTVSALEPNNNSPLKHISEIWFDRIEMIQRLGLIYLEPGEIPDIPQSPVWGGPLTFTGETSTHGTMKGRIVEITNNLPLRVEFEFSKIPNVTFGVIYSYMPERPFPPFSIIGYKNNGNNRQQLWEFQLPMIETGLLGPDFQGFTPDQFMSSDQFRQAKRFIENGDRVAVVQNGSKAVTLPRQTPDYGLLELGNTISPKEINTVRTVMWLLLIGSTLCLIWLVKRQKQK